MAALISLRFSPGKEAQYTSTAFNAALSAASLVNALETGFRNSIYSERFPSLGLILPPGFKKVCNGLDTTLSIKFSIICIKLSILYFQKQIFQS